MIYLAVVMLGFIGLSLCDWVYIRLYLTNYDYSDFQYLLANYAEGKC